MVCAQVLDNMWVLYGTQKATLLLKLSHNTRNSRGGKFKEGRVKDFSSTGQVVTHGLTDGTIRSNPKRLSFKEFNSLIMKLILGLGLLSHCSSRPACGNYSCSHYSILATLTNEFLTSFVYNRLKIPDSHNQKLNLAIMN